MGVARYSALASVVDGKIYVLGGCGDPKSSKWGEVFDPMKETWDAMPMPPSQFNIPSMCESIVIEEEKVLARNGAGRCLSYIPSERKWKKGNKDMSAMKRCWHVIENVMYCSESGGRILWCEPREWERPEPEVVEWREVMGLEALRESLAASKLVNYGGRLLDHWEAVKPQRLEAGLEIMELDGYFPGHKLSNSGPNMLIFWDVLAPHKLEIWCAEISLERRKETSEIKGNIVWSEAVMTLDPSPHQQHCKILYALPLNL